MTDFHVYAVEWSPGRVAHSVDGELVRTVDQAPDYPMQMMIGVFDFPAKPDAASYAGHVPRLVIDDVRRADSASSSTSGRSRSSSSMRSLRPQSRGSRDRGSAETPASGTPTPMDVLGPQTTSEAGRRDEDIRLSPVMLERQDDVADDEIPRRDLRADSRVPRGRIGDEFGDEREPGELVFGLCEAEGWTDALLEALDGVMGEMDGEGGHVVMDAVTATDLTRPQSSKNALSTSSSSTEGAAGSVREKWTPGSSAIRAKTTSERSPSPPANVDSATDRRRSACAPKRPASSSHTRRRTIDGSTAPCSMSW